MSFIITFRSQTNQQQRAAHSGRSCCGTPHYYRTLEGTFNNLEIKRKQHVLASQQQLCRSGMIHISAGVLSGCMGRGIGELLHVQRMD